VAPHPPAVEEAQPRATRRRCFFLGLAPWLYWMPFLLACAPEGGDPGSGTSGPQCLVPADRPRLLGDGPRGPIPVKRSFQAGHCSAAGPGRAPRPAGDTANGSGRCGDHERRSGCGYREGPWPFAPHVHGACGRTSPWRLLQAISLVLTVVGAPACGKPCLPKHGHQSWGIHAHPARNSPESTYEHLQGWIGADRWPSARSAPAQAALPCQECDGGCWGAPLFETACPFWIDPVGQGAFALGMERGIPGQPAAEGLFLLPVP